MTATHVGAAASKPSHHAVSAVAAMGAATAAAWTVRVVHTTPNPAPRFTTGLSWRARGRLAAVSGLDS
ncbi:hypothetical protein R4172_17730 [Rhodococcus kroppenstedtii]|uniref:hypothetical protein n=1 Tax=Rhodococcoides kroppenstedtii TaxID=293050 RepID=UPI002953F580|nr:hypothetical protein [Rhodococcus kroppenstedtii]MDV7199389.1 hypothetical protein [Rhodococcus kroppenstedtii]